MKKIDSDFRRNDEGLLTQVSVIPAKAGIHNRLIMMDSDLRRNDEGLLTQVSVIPAKAGIHNRLIMMDSDLRRNDEGLLTYKLASFLRKQESIIA